MPTPRQPANELPGDPEGGDPRHQPPDTSADAFGWGTVIAGIIGVTGAAIGAAGTNLTQRVTNKVSRERETAARGYTDRTKYLDGKVAAVDDAQQSLDRLFGVYFAYIVGINSSPENGQHQSLSTVIEAAGNFQSKVANIGDKALAVATDELWSIDVR